MGRKPGGERGEGGELYAARARERRARNHGQGPEPWRAVVFTPPSLPPFPRSAPTPGVSKYAVKLQQAVDKAAADPSACPVLVFGEPGLQKDKVRNRGLQGPFQGPFFWGRALSNYFPLNLPLEARPPHPALRFSLFFLRFSFLFSFRFLPQIAALIHFGSPARNKLIVKVDAAKVWLGDAWLAAGRRLRGD